MQPVSASDFIDCVLAFDGLERDLSFELSGVPLSPCLHRFLPPTRQPFYTLRGCPNFGVHYTHPCYFSVAINPCAYLISRTATSTCAMSPGSHPCIGKTTFALTIAS